MGEESECIALGCTRDRRAFFRAMWPLALVTSFELSVMLIALIFAVHSVIGRAVGIAAIFGILLLAAVTLLSPLLSGHALRGDKLHVRFGLGPKSLRAVIGLDEIASSSPLSEHLASMHALKPYFDAQRGRLVAAFSGAGQVLLRLRASREVSFGWGRRAVIRELLVNFDEPKLFLSRLAARPARERTVAPLRSARPRSPATPLRPGEKDLVVLHQLTRHFGARCAVDRLDLRIAQGEIYGLLGCNGAGKTTTIRMLVGLLGPSAGTVHVLGKDVWNEPIHARRVIGYSGDSALLYDRLTGREFLGFLAQMHGIPAAAATTRIEELLTEVGLAGDADRVCGSYSLGMKRRLSFAAALLHRPRILVLDEPLSGLDPRSASQMKARIRAAAEGGTSVLLSTHDLATAEELCHRIGVLHQGQLIAEGTAGELREEALARNLEEAFLSLTDETEASA